MAGLPESRLRTAPGQYARQVAYDLERMRRAGIDDSVNAATADAVLAAAASPDPSATPRKRWPHTTYDRARRCWIAQVKRVGGPHFHRYGFRTSRAAYDYAIERIAAHRAATAAAAGQRLIPPADREDR